MHTFHRISETMEEAKVVSQYQNERECAYRRLSSS